MDIIVKLKEYCKLPIIFYNKLLGLTIKPPLIKNSDETLDKILLENCSISRYGDGEFSIMLGKDLYFQNHSTLLKERLNEIINSEQPNHIVGIPYVLKEMDNRTPKSKAYWSKYLNANRSKIYRIINLKKEYFDAQVTRFYIGSNYKSQSLERIEKFKRIWNNRNILIVEGEKSRFGRGNDLLDNCNSIKRIICPAENAFSKYDNILYETIKQNKSDLVLIALGPTATVLAYDLALKGFQAIDIGHIDIEYEWYLNGATEQTPINSKYVGEVSNGTNTTYIDDLEYENQIIKKIIN